jgi:ATP-dependent RNA helicase RhlE
LQFNTFNLHHRILSAIEKVGFEEPTEIQRLAIPVALEGRDVMGLAQTGTGKTAAFALPFLQRHLKAPRGRVSILVLAPTRELADQINDAVKALGVHTPLRSTAVYGGVNINRQIKVLDRGVEIVVACPGRLLDHLGRGTIDLSHVECLVLDEADRMCDMGFLPDVKRILKALPRKRQTMLFSATMPGEIRSLAKEILRSPETVQAGTLAPASSVSHALYPVVEGGKSGLLMEILGRGSTGSVIVFTRTKHRARRVALQLDRAGHRATSLQGNLSQNQRQRAIRGFRNGEFKVLVATDIASRGIDVSQVSHVINYDIPDTVEAYTHRIGRTGRVARSGDAYTFVTDGDRAMICAIEKVLGSRIERCGTAAREGVPAVRAKKPSAGQQRRTAGADASRPPRRRRNREAGGHPRARVA